MVYSVAIAAYICLDHDLSISALLNFYTISSLIVRLFWALLGSEQYPWPQPTRGSYDNQNVSHIVDRRFTVWATREVYPCPCPCACVISCVQLYAMSWTRAHQALLSMKFSSQEYWNGLPFSTPGDLPDPVMKPTSLVSPVWAEGIFTIAPHRKPKILICVYKYIFKHICIYIYIYEMSQFTIVDMVIMKSPLEMT